MKYQLGDKVLLLHSNEEGEVVDIINDKMVMVDVGGVQFPVYTDQIDFPYFKRFSEQTAAQKNQVKKPHKVYIDNVKKEKPAAKYKVSDGVWLAFLPVYDKNIFDDDVVESFKLYLINQTDAPYNFEYAMISGSNDFGLKNQVLPLSDFYLHDIAFEEMNDVPKFEFDFSLVQPNKDKASHFETSLKIKAKTLFKRIEEMHEKNEPTFSFLLFEKYPDKQEEMVPEYNAPSKMYYDASRVRQNLEPAQSVVDLHIEKLTDSWKQLSNFEMLTLQLNAFEKYYQLALAHHQPSLTVIHGIGTGKLKEEIHEILKSKKEVKSFVNQYHPNFGYGATEIYFQY
ncbi:MAG TPA: Smr/MutS family protein [Chitinophagaceae bacterium]|nr:Smr/MutS family protein [Chitinophagaceae bacterium]